MNFPKNLKGVEESRIRKLVKTSMRDGDAAPNDIKRYVRKSLRRR